MRIYFYTSVAASALSLVLSIILFAVGLSNQSLQAEVQKKQDDVRRQQEEINKGAQIAQQVGPALLKDMAQSAVKNEKMRELLKKNGYEIKLPASPAPGASPAPAAKAPPAAPAGGSEPALRQ
jgi:hypothetical protein